MPIGRNSWTRRDGQPVQFGVAVWFSVPGRVGPTGRANADPVARFAAMTRIVGGSAGGRRIAVPGGRSTRPTSDRAREALFSTLESMLGDLAGTRVLDLYAGTGAVGLEALSRGAAAAVLVESHPRALAVLRANVKALALPGAQVVARSVAPPLAEALPEGRFDVVFADPPFELPASVLAGVLGTLVADRLTAGAIVVVERPSREAEFGWPSGLIADRSRRYGESRLAFARAAGSTPGREPDVQAAH